MSEPNVKWIECKTMHRNNDDEDLGEKHQSFQIKLMFPLLTEMFDDITHPSSARLAFLPLAVTCHQ